MSFFNFSNIFIFILSTTLYKNSSVRRDYFKGLFSMSESHYVLWDFDETLAFRDGMWSDTLYSVLIKNEITYIEKEDIKPFLRNGFSWHSPDIPHIDFFCGKKWWEYYEKYFQKIYEKLGVKRSVSSKLCKNIKDEYLNITKWHLYPDTEEALEILINNNYINVIISNHVPELSEIANMLNIGKYFHKIYSSANIGYEKPNKYFYDFIIKDLYANRNNCIVIGDSYDADIVGAIGANIVPILVRKENNRNYKWYCRNLENIRETIELIRQKNLTKAST